jgi:NAD(P)-dependent dehydrogenase (short-subunit alcohol dehydrogenase family)
MGTLQGKVALITGGNSGIGRSTALAFARHDAKVVVAARRAEQGEEVAHEITVNGGEGIFIGADMSKPSDVEALIHKAVSSYGRIDCAFNNAATEGTMRLTTDFTEEEFDSIMNVNLKGVWLCLRHEIQQMLKQQPGGGSIVNTSSTNGLGGIANGSLYAATKAGVIALTKSAAQEYGDGQSASTPWLLAHSVPQCWSDIPNVHQAILKLRTNRFHRLCRCVESGKPRKQPRRFYGSAQMQLHMLQGTQ